MTNLEQLKKDARFNWRAVFGSGGTVEREVGEFLDTLINHIHEQTVRECIGVIPSAWSIIMDNETEHIEVKDAGIELYRTEAITRLEALRNPGV